MKIAIIDFVVSLLCSFCAGAGLVCFLWLREIGKEELEKKEGQ